MTEDLTKKDLDPLPWRLQTAGFALALALSALLLAASYALFSLARDLPIVVVGQVQSPPPFSTVLSWVFVAGFLGGAGRSLFMFIWEVGGHAGRRQAAHYLSKWFLYLAKPFMGVAGGLCFVLAVNLGLVPLTEIMISFEQ